MSVRHHELQFTHHQRETQLLQIIEQCSEALERSVHFISTRVPKHEIPDEILKSAIKFSAANLEGL